MFIIVCFAIEELLDGRVKRSEPTLLLGVGEVDRLISAGGRYVELGLEDIDAGCESA